MRFARVICLAVLAGFGNLVSASDFRGNEAQFGLYLTKHFGHQVSVPMQYGVQFDYSYRRDMLGSVFESQIRPALFDLQFNKTGVLDFRASGVSAMQPEYYMGASEGGFLSFVNWNIVGLAVAGAVILSVAEDDKEDRLERIAEVDQAANNNGSAGANEGEDTGGDDGGAEGPTGTPLDVVLGPLSEAGSGGAPTPPGGGGDPVLGCDPALGSGQCL